MLRLPFVLDASSRMSPPDNPQLTVEMAYLPTLSINRYRTGRGIIRYEVQCWMDELAKIVGMMTRTSNIQFKPPIKIELELIAQDKRHPDIHNLHKVVADGISLGLEIDDKHFLFEDKSVIIGENPRLIITVRERKAGKLQLKVLSKS